MLTPLSVVAMIACLLLAMATDLRSRRIPNWLTIGGVSIAVALQIPHGGGLFLSGILGAALGLGVGFAFYTLGALAAGDGKLLSMVGAFVGVRSFFFVLVLIAIVGGVMGFLALAKRVGLANVFVYLYAQMSFVLKEGPSALKVSHDGAITVPYGVAIGLGSIASLFWLL